MHNLSNPNNKYIFQKTNLSILQKKHIRADSLARVRVDKPIKDIKIYQKLFHQSKYKYFFDTFKELIDEMEIVK